MSAEWNVNLHLIVDGKSVDCTCYKVPCERMGRLLQLLHEYYGDCRED